MNFFDKKYQEPITTDKEFGVCDDENGKIAYTDRSDKNKWIATIKKGGAISIAKKQLKSTIEIFNEIHPKILLEYKSRKAFICNKKHPYFKKIENSEQKEFWQLYKVRLDINTEIIFK